MSSRRSEKFLHRSPDFIGPKEDSYRRTQRLNRQARERYLKARALNPNREVKKPKRAGFTKSDDLTFHKISNKAFRAMEQKERDDRKRELEDYRNKPVWKPKRSA